VAEDNPTNQDVIRRQLNKLGFVCDIADDGRQALKMADGKNYGLVLTDCHMPEMDGYDLTRALRAGEQEAGTHLPVVAITASILAQEHGKCFAAGMDDVLTKPLAMEALSAALAKWLPATLPAPPTITSEPLQPALVPLDGSRDGGKPPLLDLTFLMDTFGGDTDTVNEILGEFVDPAQGLLDTIQQAVAQADAKAVKGAAHSLKSAARSIGANDLANLCQETENASLTEDWSRVRGRVGDIFDAAQTVFAYIQSR
jgi:CheY-like chemotaxis protein/HPt (histidine-containing phosphotransfer) domain-containing protein